MENNFLKRLESQPNNWEKAEAQGFDDIVEDARIEVLSKREERSKGPLHSKRRKKDRLHIKMH
jgi:hypothetical protein